jgi:hypothetical protein
MHSIASPVDEILFSRASAIWAAFYIRMFDFNDTSMSSKQIGTLLKDLSRLFGVRFNWYWYSATRDTWNQEEINGTQNHSSSEGECAPKNAATNPATA